MAKTALAIAAAYKTRQSLGLSPCPWHELTLAFPCAALVSVHLSHPVALAGRTLAGVVILPPPTGRGTAHTLGPGTSSFLLVQVCSLNFPTQDASLAPSLPTGLVT